jgi:hypothetical protein
MERTNNEIASFEFDQIIPELTIPKIQDFLKDHDKKLLAKVPANAYVNSLPENIKLIIESVYVLKSLKTRAALKARFSQFLEYDEEFKNYKLETDNKDATIVNDINLVLKQNLGTQEGRCIWVLFYEFFDMTSLSRLENAVRKKVQGTLPDEIFLVCDKIERRAASDKEIIRTNNAVVNLVFVTEVQDHAKPFQDVDWIQVGESWMRGFNFDSVADIVNFIKSQLPKGKYVITAETPQGESKVLWEGLIFPKQLLHEKYNNGDE